MKIRLRSMVLGTALALIFAQSARAEDGVEIKPDIVYGHKDGMALTFDAFRPTADANGAAVLSNYVDLTSIFLISQ